MRDWERDRVAKLGDGMQFTDLSSDFEGYFEGLRLFAGDPADGTSGRILPKYDPKWKNAFSEVIVQARLRWWEKERRNAIAKTCVQERQKSETTSHAVSSIALARL
jgi:hypothetical protein